MSFCIMDVDDLIKNISQKVIAWEKKNWVPYPWRVDRTPYKVLIAELLLKRTTRQAVSRVFPRFVQRFPTIFAIQNASEDALEEALRPLGLYKQRAYQLKQLADVIIERYEGRIPNSWDNLIELPGVGIYIAGAVLSFGYGMRAPVVDSNVIRLFSRLTGIKTRRYIEYLKLLWGFVPEEDHEYFNYGLIDLGALVCHYKQLRCDKCPLSEFCIHYSEKQDRERALSLKTLWDVTTRVFGISL